MAKWDGDATAVASSGRPRLTTGALDKSIARLVYRHRGSARVTVSFVKKKIVKARAFGDSLIERRLGEAGLRWLRRRRKSLVPAAHRPARITFGTCVPVFGIVSVVVSARRAAPRQSCPHQRVCRIQRAWDLARRFSFESA